MQSFFQYADDQEYIIESRIDNILPKTIRNAIVSGGGKIYQIGGCAQPPFFLDLVGGCKLY